MKGFSLGDHNHDAFVITGFPRYSNLINVMYLINSNPV